MSDHHGMDVDWSTVKNVISKYTYGVLFDDAGDENSLIKFRKVTDNDISTVRSSLAENRAMTYTDLQRRLADTGTSISKATVQRGIKEAGYTASSPRYCQMIRDVNKETRVTFCKQLVADSENFADIIFTDECTVQLHDNKVVIYRLKDEVALPIPKPKHPLKLYVWGGISRRGTTPLLIFDRIFKSDFFIEKILNQTLLPFIQSIFPDKPSFSTRQRSETSFQTSQRIHD